MHYMQWLLLEFNIFTNFWMLEFLLANLTNNMT